MGGGASTAAGVKARIDEVEEKTKGKTEGTGDEELDLAKACAKELRDIMDILAEAKTPDMTQIDRLGIISDTIMHNLESRITVSLMKLPNADEIEKEIMAIAADLDSVRSHPASGRLASKFEDVKQKSKAGAEVDGAKKIAEAVKGITEASQLLAAMAEVEKELQAVTAIKPSQKVASAILAQCSALSTKCQKGYPGLLQKEGPGAVDDMSSQAAKLDVLCEEVKAAAEGEWEPLEPALRTQLFGYVTSLFNAIATQIETLLTEKSLTIFPTIIAGLEKLKPWWPLAAESPDRATETERLQNLFQQTEAAALDAAGAGMAVDFAPQLDVLREDFAVPAEESLVKRLGAIAVAAAVGKPLEALEAELAKDSERDVDAMIGSIKALSEVMDQVPPDDLPRISAGCEGLAKYVDDMVEKADTDEAFDALCKTAESYDEAHSKMSPPLDAGDALLPRTKESVCLLNLTRAEEELSKDSGLNPAKVLGHVKSIGQFLPPGGLGDAAGGKLQEVASQTSQKVGESHDTALSEGQDAKVQALQKFAESFDAAVTAATGESELSKKLSEAAAAAAEKAAAEKAAGGYAGALDADAVAAVAEKLDAVDAELSQETGMNPNAVLKGLISIVALWEPVASSTELKDRLANSFGMLKQRMATAFTESAADDNEAKLKALVNFARKVDEIQEKLGSCCPEFCSAVVSTGASQDLLDAKKELEKDKGMNPAVVLKNLRNLKLYWAELDSAELKAQLFEICENMRSRITSSYTDNPEKRAGLLNFAGSFDAAIDGLDGAGEANLKAQLEAS